VITGPGRFYLPGLGTPGTAAPLSAVAKALNIIAPFVPLFNPSLKHEKCECFRGISSADGPMGCPPRWRIGRYTYESSGLWAWNCRVRICLVNNWWRVFIGNYPEFMNVIKYAIAELLLYFLCNSHSCICEVMI